MRVEICDQGGRRLVDAAADLGQRPDDAAVVVPVLVAGHDLDETHPPFDQPSGDQAAGAEVLGGRIVDPVQCLRLGRFSRDVQRLASLHLHSGRQRITLQPRREIRLAGMTLKVLAVDLLEEREDPFLGRSAQ